MIVHGEKQYSTTLLKYLLILTMKKLRVSRKDV